jgi:hypothetical protein
VQARIVPLIVEYDAFWTRYFYRLHRLEQKHQAFQALAQRAQQGGGEEEVSACASVWGRGIGKGGQRGGSLCV